MNYTVIWVLSGVVFGVWMYRDATSKKLKNPSVWIWIGLFFGIFGLATYWYWHIYPRQKKRK